MGPSLKLSGAVVRRLHWLNLPGALLVALLQRTPVLRIASLAEEAVAGSPAGMVLKSMVATVASLGALHSLAGATTLTTNSYPSPLQAMPGTAIPRVVFGVSGTQAEAGSWELLTGSTLPAGLSFGPVGGTSRLTLPGTVNTSNPSLEGTPITSGSYTLRLVAWEQPDRQGTSSPTFTYVINVGSSGTASVPAITTQPASQIVGTGADVTFTVAASGSPAPAYQWKKSGIDILGQTSSTLTLLNVTSDNNGTYTVTATNAAGSVTSNAAALTVTSTPAVSAPVITTQPASQAVGAGSNVTFTVVANGKPDPTYQWRKGGIDLSGQTAATLTLSNVSVLDQGTYTVVAKNSSGQVTSAAAVLDVNGSSPMPTINTQPRSVIVLTGSTVALAVSASNVATYQWLLNGIAVSNSNVSTLILTNVGALQAGAYTVVMTNGTNSVTSTTATVTIASLGAVDSRLSNLSVLGPLAANESLTVGFVSDGAKDVLVRAAGPALAPFGRNNFYADPKLTLFANSTVLASNDDWSPALSSTFTRLGSFAFALNSKDAALLQRITGPATAQANGTGSGDILVEAYDADEGATTTRLINVSARNQVGTGAGILIAGFVIEGPVAKTVLVRGIGPALKAFSISGTLPDPVLAIYKDSTKIAENDNWSTSLSTYFTKVGAFSFTAGSEDSALLITLPPGAYTAHVSGRGTVPTGAGMVEVYVVP